MLARTVTGGEPRYRRVALTDPAARSPRLPRGNTSDLSEHDGHYYPNKPPGISFLAAPAYALLLHAERVLDLDPDAWWTLTLNGWLTTVFSVGLFSALGGVLFLGCVRRLFPDASSHALVAATLSYGLGTLVLPYATMLIDHAVVAACSLLTLWL